MKIQYDRHIMRMLIIAAVVVSVPTCVGMICGVFFDDMVSTFGDVMVVTSVITFCPMAGLWLACLDSWLYLMEIAKAGYEVPDDRRKYNGVLENLPRRCEPYSITDGRDRESLISACITAACALCFVAGVLSGGAGFQVCQFPEYVCVLLPYAGWLVRPYIIDSPIIEDIEGDLSRRMKEG